MFFLNDIELIRGYLDLFKFLEICQITKNEYKYVKDIEEYVILRNIFCQKCQDVEFDKLEKIISTIVDGNPYDVFETFSWQKAFVVSKTHSFDSKNSLGGGDCTYICLF